MEAFAHEVELQEVPIYQIGNRRLPIGDAGELPYYATRELDGSAGGEADVIVVVHGALRNAGHYYRSVLRAAMLSGGNPVVVAPQFLADVDVRDDKERAGLLHWGTDSWKDGRGEPGSFHVMDELLTALPRAFREVRRVTVVGNSAGGQFVNRYAAVGRAPDDARLAGRVRFVVANPSTFLYFDDFRPAPGGGFARRADGAAVGRWRYGFTDPPAYVRKDHEDAYFEQYISRDVTYLLGKQDTSPDASLLEVHPAAAAQGADRRERGRNYSAYLAWKAGHPVHRLVEVDHVGHDAADLFTSDRGIGVLFPPL
ncbi:hypothetical protein GCM10022221_29340 [Actinocorallia aurea]